MSTASVPWGRRALLVGAAASALVAVLAGLARIGFAVPGGGQAMDHGPLFVLGVFGTLVALERAVALGERWAFAAPVLGTLGALGTLAHVSGSAWSSALGTLALVVVNAAIVRRQSAAFTWLMLLGSSMLALGTLGWALGRGVFEVVPAWLSFFVLTILAERLELSRLAPTPRWATRFFVTVALLEALASVGACLSLRYAPEVLGASFVALAVWQMRFDLARRTVRRSGLPRFTALGVLLGTGWLSVSGLLLLCFGLPLAGPTYDAVLHSLLVGFVLSMVFAHAPIILPAVARIELPFDRVLYLPLTILHVGLVLRVLGDLASLADVRKIGAATNALALATFFVAVLVSRARHARGPAPR